MAEASSVPLVLVTGASGYIATHIIQQLLTAGRVKVRGTVRSVKNEAKVAPLRELVPDAIYPLELVEADLLNEDSWKEAAKGCTYVYHVASPVAFDGNEEVMIRLGVDGTLNVLRACAEAGTVKRVVVTSSSYAICPANRGDPNHLHTEADWADEALCGAYEKSKLYAERAAWDFVEKLEDEKKFELAVVNPTACLGPLLTQTSSSTLEFIVESVLSYKQPTLLDYCFSTVDIRDVAAGHIAAMEKPEAAGNRYLLHCKNLWMREIADLIRNEFGPQGYVIPSRMAPKGVLWVMKFFNSTMKWVYPQLGRAMQYSNEKMKTELGIEPRDTNQAIIDACYSLIEKGVVAKKPGYRGPPSAQPQKPTEATTEEQQPPEATTEEQQSTEATTEEQQSTETTTEEQQSTEAATEEQRATDAATEEQQATEATTEEQQSTEAAIEEQRATDAATEEQQATETATEEQQSTEAATEEQQATETATEEQQPTEATIEEQQATEAATEEQQATEATTEEQQATEATTEEQQPTEATTEEQ